MNVASLELCKELYELSGWVSSCCHTVRNEHGVATSHWYQYELGYLLRSLPQRIDLDEDKWAEAFDSSTPETFFLAWEMDTMQNRWRVQMQIEDEVITPTLFEAASPEDALCQLFIELFKQGVLTKAVV